MIKVCRKDVMRRIGAHVSIAGGIENSPERAQEIGCNCVQIFSGSPRVWKKPDLASHNIKQFLTRRQELGIEPAVTHAIYLVNLASDKKSLIEKSVATLTYDMKFDAAIQGGGVAVHLGSHQGRGWEVTKDQLAQLIKEVIAASPAEAMLLIENSAGQNGKIASDLDEIRWLLDEVDSQQLGWCFDTCHAFAAGYALGKKIPPQTEQSKHHRQETALAAIERLQLWEALKCVHVNDSRDEFGSGRDRHENLGQGKIAADDLQYFLNQPQLKQLPLILEVPGFAGKGPDEKNVQILQDLVK